MDVLEFIISNWKTILSIVLTLGIVEFLRCIYRQRKLKNPVNMHFYIPKKDHINLNYVSQSETDHLVDELVLPSNRNCLIMIWYRPKIDYHENSKYFGFKKGKYKTKPIPIKWFNPFVLKGKDRVCSPENNSNHYLDWWGHYHIISEKDVNKDEIYTGGFIVKTPDIEGEYELVSSIHTSSRLGKKILKVKIRHLPFNEKIFCIGFKENKIFRKKEWHPEHPLIFTSKTKEV